MKPYDKLSGQELAALYTSYKKCFGGGIRHQSGLSIAEWYKKHGIKN